MLGTICCLGGNKAGGILCSVIASKCPEIKVDVLDSEANISKWNKNSNPIDEPGLDKILKKCRNRNLFFSSNYSPLKHADMVIVSTDLSIKRKGYGEGKSLNIKPLEDAARLIAGFGETDKIVVEKSAAPRAAESMSALLNANSRSSVHYQVLSNPEFGEESMDSLLNADRIVIGCPNNPAGRAAAESLSWVYEHWIPRKNIIILSIWSATLTRLAISSFIAQKVTSMNTLTEICEKTGVDVSQISSLMLPNEILGPKNMSASLNLGGIREEILSFLFTCQNLKEPEIVDYWKSVLDYSDYHRGRFIEKLSNILGPLANKKISVWGVACKHSSQLIKESPALEICKFLLTHGAKIKIYEPKIDKHEILSELYEWKGVGDKTIFVTSDPYEASADTHAIIVCNDWEDLNQLNYPKVYDKMIKPSVVLDGQKCLEGSALTKCGFAYYTIGAG